MDKLQALWLIFMPLKNICEAFMFILNERIPSSPQELGYRRQDQLGDRWNVEHPPLFNFPKLIYAPYFCLFNTEEEVS
jgi:hypothetical protein